MGVCRSFADVKTTKTASPIPAAHLTPQPTSAGPTTLRTLIWSKDPVTRRIDFRWPMVLTGSSREPGNSFTLSTVSNTIPDTYSSEPDRL